MTEDEAPEIARFLAERLDVDYFDALLKRLRDQGSRFEYLARRVPSTLAADVLREAEDRGFEGLSTRRDPVRSYPAPRRRRQPGRLHGDRRGLRRPRADLRQGALRQGRLEHATRSAAATGSRSATTPPCPRSTAQDLHTTIDRDLQWYTQRVLRHAVENAGGELRASR